MLHCTGQSVRRFDNQPTGILCYAQYAGAIESARVMGWRVGPADADGNRPAMCPSCARPGAGDDDEVSGQVELEPLPGL